MADDDTGLSEFIDLSQPKTPGYPEDIGRFPKAMAKPTPEPAVYEGPNCEKIEVPCFEIGLVLAGAVSAGAYTAGVLDYLIEVLDRWEVAKEAEARAGKAPEDWSVPPHAVRIKVVAGASAGSVCAALLAVAGKRQFLPVRATPANRKGPDAHRADNPFYDLWVNRLDIREMLNTADIGRDMALGDLPSLLNSSVVAKAANAALDSYPPAAGSFPRERRYLADPLRVALSVANLDGIPYCYRFEGLEGARFATTRHADSMRFAVYADGPPQPGQVEGGVYPVGGTPTRDKTQNPDADAWVRLADAALASGAFPLAFAPIRLKKTPDDYRFDLRLRADLGPSPARDYSRKGKMSAGFSTVSGAFTATFDTVDGGTMNNQPFQYARQVLAGPLGQLEDREPGDEGKEDGAVARKAMVIIDPFPAKASDTHRQAKRLGVGTAAQKLLRAWIDQARYDANDLALAADPNIYSRFMLSPMRARLDGKAGTRGTTALGQDAIASGAMGGFSGFLDRRYRHHDFLLGRRNAENFLRNYFALPDTNSLFDQVWWSRRSEAEQAEQRTLTAEPGQAKESERLIVPRMPLPGAKPFEHWKPERRHPDEDIRKFFVRDMLCELSPVWPGAIDGPKFSAADLAPPIKTRLDAILKLVVKEFAGGVPSFLAAPFRKYARDKLAKRAVDALDKAIEEHRLRKRDG
jgi:predicted acylesterase/phospholipase RssA